MKSTGERIQERVAELEEAGREVSVAQIAEAAGISRQAVYQWFNGASRKLKGENLLAVAKLLGVNEQWLENGKGPKLPSALPEDHGVPVVGTAQLGDDGYWLELEYPMGHGEGFIRYPMKDPNTYALRVKGDSMRPRIKPGEFVVIEPNHAISPGEEVMVKTTDGRSMVKLLGWRRDGMVELQSVNEDHRPITLDEKQISAMHYVGAIVKPSWYFERS